jgi:hypothetical protein
MTPTGLRSADVRDARHEPRASRRVGGPTVRPTGAGLDRPHSRSSWAEYMMLQIASELAPRTESGHRVRGGARQRVHAADASLPLLLSSRPNVFLTPDEPHGPVWLAATGPRAPRKSRGTASTIPWLLFVSAFAAAFWLGQAPETGEWTMTKIDVIANSRVFAAGRDAAEMWSGRAGVFVSDEVASIVARAEACLRRGAGH